MQSVQITQIIAEAGQEVLEPSPRVALLTSYSGGNLGDAAIQDAMIANLRQRMPGVQFLGITLNCDNFLKQHGVGAFPLLAASMPFSYRSPRDLAKKSNGGERSTMGSDYPGRKGWANPIKRALRSVPGLVPFLKRARAWVVAILREIFHSFEAYRVLRKQDLLVVSGGGQLDEEWGGAWRLPFALCKWVLLARVAGVPRAVASVGAGKMRSPASRMFVSLALRMCSYRSYRDTKSRAIAASFLSRATNDSVVPDLAFSLPDSELPSPVGGIRTMARGRPVIALSPIAYAKPGNWPTPDGALHDRYVQQMAQVLSCLSRQGYFLIVVCSSLGDDEGVIPDLLGRMDDEMKHSLDGQLHFPTIRTWRDLVAVLRDTDYLIASRLHGTILGFVTQTPAVAISFDPKVDWVMEDLHQTDYLLQIRDFTAEQVLNALDRIKVRRDAVVERIASYRQGILSASARQYDSLTRLVLAHHQSHN
jgi:polysaccharide pyruvyl transferase WcaK-like protein